MKSKILRLLAVGLLCVTGPAAQAVTVSLSNITASWYDGNPAANVTYSGNGGTSPDARWGTGGNQSGYDFDVAAQPINFTVPPSPSPNQVLGTLTHQNFPISSGTSITDIKLGINAQVFIDNVSQGFLNFNYGFDHFETPNGDNPCADGGTNGVGVNINGCADRVIANWLSTSDSFVIDNGTTIDTYTLNVIGFSLNSNGTSPFTSFWTAEGMSNLAYLVGNVTLRSVLVPVPEPGTLALLFLGLLGLGAARRKAA